MADILKGSEQLVTLPSRNYVSPVVSRERFAEMVGLPLGVVVGFINKGYLPTVSIGKYSLVNVAAIQRSCSEKEFSL
ncbi:hypothetical protein [Herbaspirillum rubrisubalbicans]|uniref:hypothetical protein n=1 Tax=Herbaspirillum rubrisubalbicans TaxID=80842 RepID=UPI000DD2C094|nr:hypothetical protein [Herbaspirillum rubrisubalbicans]